MGHIHSVAINNAEHLVEPVLFASTGGTSSALTATITNFELVSGVSITLKITVTNSASATLAINGGTASAIYYKNATIDANILKQNHIYNLVYDGTKWHVVGERLSSSENVLPHKLTFGAGGIYQYDGSADVTVPVYTGAIL